MATRSLADRLLLLLPLAFAFVFMLLAAVPWHLGVAMAPQVLWLMILTLGVSYPAAWPPLAAFVLGLIADTLSATPLGSQALLAVLATLAMRRQSRRLAHQPFRVRWMEAAVALLVLNIMLWAVIGWIVGVSLPTLPVLRAALVSSLWFPLFYLIVEQLVRMLPPKG